MSVAAQAEVARKPHVARTGYQAKPSRRPRPKPRPGKFPVIYPLLVLLFACAMWYVSIYADVTICGLRHSQLSRQVAQESNINSRLKVQAQSMVSAERAKYLGMQAGMQPAIRFDHVRAPERVASSEPRVR